MDDTEFIAQMRSLIARYKPAKVVFTPHTHHYDWSYNPRTKYLFLNVAWTDEFEGTEDGR